MNRFVSFRHRSVLELKFVVVRLLSCQLVWQIEVIFSFIRCICVEVETFSQTSISDDMTVTSHCVDDRVYHLMPFAGCIYEFCQKNTANNGNGMEKKVRKKTWVEIEKISTGIQTKLKWIHLMTMHFNRHLKSDSGLFQADKKEEERREEMIWSLFTSIMVMNVSSPNATSCEQIDKLSIYGW